MMSQITLTNVILPLISSLNLPIACWTHFFLSRANRGQSWSISALLSIDFSRTACSAKSTVYICDTEYILWRCIPDNGVLTLPDIETDTETERLVSQHRTQQESVLVSASVQYEHLHTIVYNPFWLVSLSVSVSAVWTCHNWISTITFCFFFTFLKSKHIFSGFKW